jgi:putative NADH-flavin reductase
MTWRKERKRSCSLSASSRTTEPSWPPRSRALQAADTTVSWFYVSPPFGFGAHNPGTTTGTFRLGTDVLITDADGNADISGADFAMAIADEIEKPAHRQTRFTLGY